MDKKKFAEKYMRDKIAEVYSEHSYIKPGPKVYRFIIKRRGAMGHVQFQMAKELTATNEEDAVREVYQLALNCDPNANVNTFGKAAMWNG